MCPHFQSQGSLSELLSKSKAWPQLTERGRESFRRIAAWQCDETCIEMLVAFVKRRQTTITGQPPVPTPFDDVPIRAVDMDAMYAEEGDFNGMPLNNRGRYAAQTRNSSHVRDSDSPAPSFIISASNGAHHMKPAAADSVDYDEHRQRSSSRQRSSPSTNMMNNPRWQHDDIPKDKILEIYQRELAKLKEQEHEPAASLPTDDLLRGEVAPTRTSTASPSVDSHSAARAVRNAQSSSVFTSLRAHLPIVTQSQIDW